MIGKLVHNYEIIRPIGEGGMANVYEAKHTKFSNRKVAIKILNVGLSADANIKSRFENEAKILAELDHPNIIKVEDFIEDGASLSIVMELLEGQSLTDFITSSGGLEENEILRIFYQILDAFAYAHQRGVVHRDIKPSNIFILKNGQAKILDFGIAKIVSGDAHLTSTGAQMGTPMYMSPEQVKDAKDINWLSDIYSLGVVLYYMFAGKSPYDATTATNFDIYNKIVTEEIPQLVDFEQYNQIIAKATAKNRDERFQTCEEFSFSLQQISEGLEVEIVEKKLIEAETEDIFWTKVLELDTLEAFKEYLKEFPDGKYKKEASTSIGKKITTTNIKSKKKKPKKKKRTETKNTKTTNHGNTTNPGTFLNTPQAVQKKRSSIWIWLFVLIILAAIPTSYFLYFKEQLAWNEAKKENSLHSFRDYLSEYPDARYKSIAKQSIDWILVQKTGKIGAYQNFINKYSESLFYDEAQTKIQKLRMDSVLIINTKQAFNDYLKMYPNGYYSGDIKAKLLKIKNDSLAEENVWKNAKMLANYDSYQKYLLSYPRGKYIVEAVKYRNNLGFIPKLEMIKVEGGEFTMGNNSGNYDNRPAHKVKVNSFYISKFEITQTLWEYLMGTVPSYYKSDLFPISKISWNEAVEFINKLNALSGGNYRLPTEAEWEYAARGGKLSKGYKYAGGNNANELAWTFENSKNYGNYNFHNVGSKKANELGIYDMSGHVKEWCLDNYDSKYYKKSPTDNPTGALRGYDKVVRGGSIYRGKQIALVYAREHFSPRSKENDIGFRIVIPVTK